MVGIDGVKFKVRTNPQEFVERRISECASEGHKRERIVGVNFAVTYCRCSYCFSDYSRLRKNGDNRKFRGYVSQKVLETEITI